MFLRISEFSSYALRKEGLLRGETFYETKLEVLD